MAELTIDTPLDEDTGLRKHTAFKWLSVGAGASMLGDQLTLIAFPWLVLALTQDTLVLGIVLALVGLPRAVFILLGGAIVDRLSPKSVLLYSKYINIFLLFSLSALIYMQILTIPVLCFYALAIGIASAFAMPAGTAMLPAVVGPKQLEKANGVFMMIRQLSMFFGPLTAGVLLGSAQTADGNNANMLALLFSLDGFTFVFSALTLLQVQYAATNKKDANSNQEPDSILQSMMEGFAYFWKNTQLRAAILYLSATSCVVGGLIQVGLPILVKDRLAGGGDTFGYLVAMAGFGTIIGIIFAMKKPQVGSLSLGITFLCADIIAGVLFSGLGFVETMSAAYTLLFLVGLLTGYIQVAIFTWMQRQSSPEMMGRMMSILLFAVMGAAPVAAAAYGAILGYVDVGILFTASGITLAFIATIGLSFPQIRSIRRAV